MKTSTKLQPTNVEEELKRISAIEQKMKTTSGDTLVRATHFIKKSVMIPLSMKNDDELDQPKRVDQPFMRGIMEFDDYNYKNINKYVLIEEPKDINRRKQDLQERLDSRSENLSMHTDKITQQSMQEFRKETKNFDHEIITLPLSEIEIVEN